MATPNRMNTFSYGLVLAALVLALLAYVAPWASNPASGLTVGAYDLAEWASLSPAQRGATPPLLTSFLLRVQLVLFTLLVAIAAPPSRDRRWWLSLMVVLLLVIAQLPPLEFITHAEDVNYQQQFLLSMLSLILGLLGLSGLGNRWSGVISAAVLLLGIITSVVGWQRAQALMHDYRQPGHTGFGFYAMLAVYVVLLVYMLANQKKGSVSLPLFRIRD